MPWRVQLRNDQRRPAWLRLQAWKQIVALRARQLNHFIVGPVVVRADFYRPVPKSWPAWKREAAVSGLIAHTDRPDTDRLMVGFLDGLKGVLIEDDCYVTAVSASKTWVASEAEAGVSATIAPAIGYPAQIATKAELAAQQAAE